MPRPRRFSSVTPFLFLLLLGCSQYFCADAGQIPALFAFGDSTVDTGNCLLVRDVLRANAAQPYGKTGRFSDGKLVVDYLAEILGLPPLQPIPPNANVSSISISSLSFDRVQVEVGHPSAVKELPWGQGGLLGGSFGVCSSGVLSATPPPAPPSLADQVAACQRLLQEAEMEPETLEQALFVISAGGEDYFRADVKKGVAGPSMQLLVKKVVSGIKEAVSALYSSGARRFLILTLPPLGCAPGLESYPASPDIGELCNERVNAVIIAHNQLLKSAAHSLRERLKDAVLFTADQFDFLYTAIEDPSAVGLREVRAACCTGYPPGGYGACGVVAEGSQQPLYTVCEEPSQFLWWDGLHLTDAVNQRIAGEIYGGKGGHMLPGPLEEQLRLERPSAGYLGAPAVWQNPELAALALVSFCCAYAYCLVRMQYNNQPPPIRYNRL